MERKASIRLLTMLLIGMLTLAFNIQSVEAELLGGHESSIYYRSFGSSQPPATEWKKTYGGTGGDQAFSVQQTSEGGYIVAGYTESFGAGAYDFWLVKADASGNMVWNKTYGGIANLHVKKLARVGRS